MTYTDVTKLLELRLQMLGTKVSSEVTVWEQRGEGDYCFTFCRVVSCQVWVFLHCLTGVEVWGFLKT